MFAVPSLLKPTALGNGEGVVLGNPNLSGSPKYANLYLQKEVKTTVCVRSY